MYVCITTNQAHTKSYPNMYVCITTNQAHTKSYPNMHVCITTNQAHTKTYANADTAAKQHAIVNIQLNIGTCPKKG